MLSRSRSRATLVRVLALALPLAAVAPAAIAGDPPPPPPPLPWQGADVAPPSSAPVPEGFGVPQAPRPSPDGVAPQAPPRLSAAQLEELVGPVALYPDVVLASLLPATAFPLEVVGAARLVRAQGGKAVEAPADAPWDDSVKALLQFPDVLLWLDENLGWLEAMGMAMATQQGDVLAAIQTFRQRAKQAGHLASDDHVVVTEQPPPAVGAPPVILVEPCRPEVVYVPAYDPVVVVQPVAYAVEPCVRWSIGFSFGAFGPWSCFDFAWDCYEPGFGFGLFVYDAPCRWYEPRRSWYRSSAYAPRPSYWRPSVYAPRGGSVYRAHGGAHADRSRHVVRTTRPSWSDRTTTEVRASDHVRPPERSSPRFGSGDRRTAYAPRSRGDGAATSTRASVHDTRWTRNAPTLATDGPRTAAGPAPSGPTGSPSATSATRSPDRAGWWYRSSHGGDATATTTTAPRLRTATPGTDATPPRAPRASGDARPSWAERLRGPVVAPRSGGSSTGSDAATAPTTAERPRSDGWWHAPRASSSPARAATPSTPDAAPRRWTPERTHAPRVVATPRASAPAVPRATPRFEAPSPRTHAPRVDAAPRVSTPSAPRVTPRFDAPSPRTTSDRGGRGGRHDAEVPPPPRTHRRR